MILIKNVCCLPFNSKDRVLYGVNVYIKDNRIFEITEELLPERADKIIDGEKKILMPGLVNAHTHASMSLLRNYADDLPLDRWLGEEIWPIEGKMTEEDIYVGALLTICEMLLSGTTSFLDMYDLMDAVARAVEEIGIRAVLSYGTIDVKGQEDERIRIRREFSEHWEWKANGRITTMVAPHAPYTVGDVFMKRLKELACELNVGINIHLSETKGEVEGIIEKTGKTPIAHMNDLGLFDVHTVAAHCVHITDEDIKILKDKNVYPVNNPTSNFKLASGFSPVSKLFKAGIPVALGTDGSASNNNVNMWEEIHLAAIINKALDLDATSVSAYTALEMATINGAKALGLDKEIGSVEKGKKADLILIDTNKPHLTPLGNPVSALAYSAQASDVDTVIVDGKILMENRVLKTVDIEKIMLKMNETVNNLLSRKE